MRATPDSLRAYNAHRIAASAMCSEGSWLNGLSKLASAANIRPQNPSGAARGKREAQREQDKTGNRDQLRREQTSRMRIQLAAGRANEERQCVEEVDRPVRQYRPVPERDAGLPVEHDRGHVRALSGVPVGESI